MLVVVVEAVVLSRPEEVDYALKISRNEHNEGDDGSKDKSWRGSEAAHMSHGQDVWLKKQAQQTFFLERQVLLRKRILYIIFINHSDI